MDSECCFDFPFPWFSAARLQVIATKSNFFFGHDYYLLKKIHPYIPTFYFHSTTSHLLATRPPCPRVHVNITNPGTQHASQLNLPLNPPPLLNSLTIPQLQLDVWDLLVSGATLCKRVTALSTALKYIATKPNVVKPSNPSPTTLLT